MGAGQGSAAHTRSIIFVVGVTLMNAVAMMIVIPVLPKLVRNFTGETASAAHYVGLFAAVFALLQFIASPFLGSLSDRYGRRAVILISALGQGANFVLLALAPSLAWLLVARIISGITAGSLPAVNAYIADVVPAGRRAASYGWVSAATSTGFLLGPALGGVLGEINPRLPFWVSAGLCFLNVLYGALVMPESLKKESRAPLTLARANPAFALRFLSGRPAIASLAPVLLMLMIAQQCLPNTIVLYTDYRFGWSSGQIGAYLTVVGLANILVQSLVVRGFVSRFGEPTAVIVGFTCYTIAFLIYATAPSGAAFVAGAPFFALGGLVTPSVQAQMSRKVASDEQGRLQGALAAASGLCGLFTPIMYTQVFAFAIDRGRGVLPPGTHMYLAASFLALGAGLAGRYLYLQRTGTTARIHGEEINRRTQ
jgi:DHA1 family tetracycline resistance protein-like MFS transporter